MLNRPRPLIAMVVALVAIAFSLIGWFLYVSPTARDARSYGFSPPAYIAVNSIGDRASTRHSLTTVDMIILRAISNDAHPMMRARALTPLRYLGGTEQSAIAAEIARRKLTDSHSTVRQYALSALDGLNTSDVVEIAKKMLRDPAENVREKATLVLKRHGVTGRLP